MHPRRGTDMLSAWLLVVLGAALLLVGTIGMVEALVRGDWTEALVTAVLLLVVGFGVSRGVGQLRRARPTRDEDATDGMRFCLDLPARAGVVAIPDEVFHDDPADGKPFVRFAFCKRDEVIAQAVQRLAGMP